MLGNPVASKVQNEQISGDAHPRDMRPFQGATDGDQAVIEVVHAPQEAYVEAITRELLNSELVIPLVARHESNVLTR
jgi:hypothetical protein